MKRSLRLAIAILIGTLVGMIGSPFGPAGSRIYPPHHGPGTPTPTGLQEPILALAMVAQAIGLGIAFALLSDRRAILGALTRFAGGRRGSATAAFIGLVWAVGSWIPHVSLHLHIRPDDLWALAAIEWGFHVTIVVGAALFARCLLIAAGENARAPHARSEGRHASTDA